MTLRFAPLALIGALLLSPFAQAEILFEAFYRIETNKRHVGYMIQRLASDSKGNRVMSSYVRSRVGNDEFYVTARSTAKPGSGAPIETMHTSNGNGVPYTILANFQQNKVIVSYHSNNARKPGYSETAKNAPYPSAFMYFMTDFAKFQPGKKYSYSAFFEENGKAQIGQISLMGAKEAGGQKIYQILNDDSAQPVESFVSEAGQPLGSRSTATDTIVFWVPNKESAVADMTYPTGEFTKLFGDLPQGKKNDFAKTPGFKSVAVIDGFTAWTSERRLSSSPTTGVLPLPLRKLK